MNNGISIDDGMMNGKVYDGTIFKFGITYNNSNYMVKTYKKYKTAVYSEYIASNLISSLGIECQQVYLGYYNGKIANIIKDFTTENTVLNSFKDTRQSSEDTILSGKEYTYNDVVYLISKHSKLSKLDKTEALKRFWQMYILDAVLANRDRHNGNWGFLTDGKKSKPAPIYDNGGCLFPDVDKTIDKFKENRYKFIEERIEKFPASLLKIKTEDRLKRTNYYEIIQSHKFEQLDIELEEFKNKFNFDRVSMNLFIILYNVKEIIDYEYCYFYFLVTMARYHHILENGSIQDSYWLAYNRWKELIAWKLILEHKE